MQKNTKKNPHLGLVFYLYGLHRFQDGVTSL